LSASQESVLVNAIKIAFSQAQDVFAFCDATERVGVWFRPEGGRDDQAARLRGLATVNIVRPALGESFAGHIEGVYLTSAAETNWNQSPKLINSSGSPDPNGSIVLKGFTTSASPPSQWISTVTGTDTAPWPDVDFTMTTTDTISVANGRIQCSSANAISTDTSVLNLLTGVFLIAFPPLGGFFLYEDILASGADAPSTTAASVLCPAVAIFPAQILLPGTLQKAVFSYTRAQTDGSGVTVGGTVGIVDRAPSATITGPTTVSSVAGATAAAASFGVRSVDLRSPVQFHWSASGTVLSPAAAWTSVRFPMTGWEAVGTTKFESVSVHLVDADGAAIDVSQPVTVRVVPGGGGLPPMCKTKPWLPQCQL
jgi:hypothetical protein